MTTRDNIADLFAAKHSELIHQQNSASARRADQARHAQEVEEARRVAVVKKNIVDMIKRGTEAGGTGSGRMINSTIESADQFAYDNGRIAKETIDKYHQVGRTMGVQLEFVNALKEEHITAYTDSFWAELPTAFPWRVVISLSHSH